MTLTRHSRKLGPLTVQLNELFGKFFPGGHPSHHGLRYPGQARHGTYRRVQDRKEHNKWDYILGRHSPRRMQSWAPEQEEDTSDVLQDDYVGES